jgi:uncharacterized membrane protein YfcA
VLVGRGHPVAQVAPAALTSTFLTSIVGATTYALLGLAADGDIAPDWQTGLLCGLGGLIGDRQNHRLVAVRSSRREGRRGDVRQG